MKRRKVLQSIAGASLLSPGLSKQVAQGQTQTDKGAPPALPIEQYQPRSCLHATETKVARAAFPVIDIHTHLTFTKGLPKAGAIRFTGTPEQLLPVMDRKNLHTMVNLTGGYGENLRTAVHRLQAAHPGRFLVFTEPAWDQVSTADYARKQADLIADAHRLGVRGIKVLKTLGLFLREQGTTGALVRIDDRRFDSLWDTAGQLGMPIAIHSSDPEAFFLPIDRFNERWEELHAHPSWSFHGGDFPSNRALQEARRNVMRRHPKTHFICLHVADAENLSYVEECLAAHPNMYVDIAARIGELGRQPRRARSFFEKQQDRIVFGTDAVPGGSDTPQQIFGDQLYEIYFRFLETTDEYFDYAPAPVPPQGRWRISGIGLPQSILSKVYAGNAQRLLGLSA